MLKAYPTNSGKDTWESGGEIGVPLLLQTGPLLLPGPGRVNRNPPVDVIQTNGSAAVVDQRAQRMTVTLSGGPPKFGVDAAASIVGAQAGTGAGRNRQPDGPVHRRQRNRFGAGDLVEVGFEWAV